MIPVSKAPSFLEMNSCDSQTSSRDAECCPNCLVSVDLIVLHVILLVTAQYATIRTLLQERTCSVEAGIMGK